MPTRSTWGSKKMEEKKTQGEPLSENAFIHF